MGLPDHISTWTEGHITSSSEETLLAASAFANLLPHDLVLAIQGDIGTGKTTFIRGLLRGLGMNEDVTSPSFAILNVYNLKRQIFHVDAYRLTNPEAFDELLIWELAESPWNLLVEWPENIATRLPNKQWRIEVSILKNETHRFWLKQTF